jgi:TRAP-type C4-dicarboxylate transport system permease small subunit
MREGLIGGFLRLEQRLSTGAMAAACAMLVIALLAGFYQILSRFVIQQPAEWTEVIVRFALIWMVFLGSPMAFRQGAMVCIDLLHRMSGARMKRVLDTIVSVAALILVGVMIWWGFDYASRGRVQTIPGLEEYSMSWAYLAIPVGGIFSAFGIVGNWLDPRRLELDTAR